jgi:hypothetical protein
MAWSILGTQFSLELAFGVFVALLFVHRAPLGVFFFRLMGTAALLPVIASVALPITAGEGSARLDASTLGAGLAILAYPLYAGSVKVRRRLEALSAATLGTGVALIAVVRSAQGVASELDWAIASLSALATGCVAGSVGLAMVLGHWYLTIPDLEIGHLVRLNRITLACMAACLGAVALSYLVFFAGSTSADGLGTWGAFCLGTRVTVGLLMPMLFGWMAAQSLRYRNTRSATGILYASTVLVLIGTAVSISLQDSYGVPL